MKNRVHSLKRSQLSDLQKIAGQERLAPHSTKLWMIFAEPSVAEDPIFKKFIKMLPENDVVIGCSTAGEIYNSSVDDMTLSIAEIEFENTKLRYASGEISNTFLDSYQVGKEIAEQLTEKDLKAVLILSDGLQINGTRLLSGVNSKLGPSVVVTGGLAGDGPRFRATWTINKEKEICTGLVTAVGFYGEHIQALSSSFGGWSIFGPERLITKSSGSVVYEIDGLPALDLYKKYLGEKSAQLPSSALLFPMQIWSAEDPQLRVVRTILKIDEKDQSLTFAGDVPEGFSAQLMRGNADRLIDGATLAAKQIQNVDPGGLAIAISCVGRKLLLGERTDEEVEAVFNGMPTGTNQIGFYSYGEISPVLQGEKSHLLNQTMTITYLTEKKNAA